MIQLLQITLCSLPVILAALVTLYPSFSFVRRAFSLSRKGLNQFRIGLGVATLIDIYARANELETWHTDDGLFSRSKKWQIGRQQTSLEDGCASGRFTMQQVRW